MAELLSDQETDKILNSIVIPPRPTILLNVAAEMKRPDFDVKIIANLVGTDPALAAAVLRTVNSPFFGQRNKVSSVAQAVTLLGVKNIMQIVTAQLLRKSVDVRHPALERFWDQAERVSSIAAAVASKVLHMHREESFTFGLFRDVGIPLLAQKLPLYAATLDQVQAMVDQSMVAIEDTLHATNHTSVGYLVAKTWFLPPALCEGILHHHNINALTQQGVVEPQTATLVAINFVAEHIYDGASRPGAPRRWDEHSNAARSFLGLADKEFKELAEHLDSLMA